MPSPRNSGPMPSPWDTGPKHGGPKHSQPPWWPEGEPWPPRSGPGRHAWSGFGRRAVRFALFWVGLVLVGPLIVGVFLAVAVGGWTSVVIAIVSWIGLAVVVGIGLRIGVRSWRPVRSLIDTAGRLADGDYTARASARGHTPVRPVVDSFNRMAERLERTETDRRRLLADVGHELRTPLTIIRGELEAMADGVHQPGESELRRLLDDVVVMERLLDDLSTLSTAEAGMLKIHPEPTDVVGLVRAVVDGLTTEATQVGVDLEVVTVDDELDAEVDPVRLREIVANVVANAIRATPAGGRVVVTVEQTVEQTGEAAEAWLNITVVDDGRGIPADEVERVFDRFHKGPGSHGSGLGLTISRNLALAHGGDLTLTSVEGQGTTVEARLPVEHRP